MRNSFLQTTCISALVLAGVTWAGPALAQDAAADEGGIGEIVVTAQKKEESLQKAGIAIDAVSAEALADRGITSATDLTKAVPSLSIPGAGGTIASVFLRGVGNITTSSYNDPAVTSNYDGVVLGRGGGVFGAAFYDLQRVEVLKGPQGILYGRNATGGAINIIPVRPEIGTTGAGFNLGYGNFDAVSADAHVNIATGENSALRVTTATARTIPSVAAYVPSSCISRRAISHCGWRQITPMSAARAWAATILAASCLGRPDTPSSPQG
jgi:iron complex outermembrane receptor protein